MTLFPIHRPRRALAAPLLAAAALAGSLLAAPQAVQAHAIESSLDRVAALNEELVLESRFSTGEPADDAVVRLLPPGGEPIELGRTDASGRIRFSLPSQAGSDWEVQVDRGPGHRDYLELPGGLHGELPGRGGPALSTAPSNAPPFGLSSVRRGAPSPWFVLAGLTAIGGSAAGMLAWRRRS